MRAVSETMITVPQAAERMGCHRSWIHYLIKAGRLKAERVGPVYLLKPKDVDACDVRPRAKPSTNGHTPKTLKKRNPVKAGKLSTPKRGR